MLLVFLKVLVLGGGFLVGSCAFGVFLYRAIHFIEEHPTKAKEKITLMIYAVSLFHLVLLFRGFSFLNVAFSLLCQYLFYSMLPEYPRIETVSPAFILSLVLVLVNHFWYLKVMVVNSMGTLEILFYFLFCVWATPFAFFLSLTANDDVILEEEREAKSMRRTFAGKILDTLLDTSDRLRTHSRRYD